MRGTARAKSAHPLTRGAAPSGAAHAPGVGAGRARGGRGAGATGAARVGADRVGGQQQLASEARLDLTRVRAIFPFIETHGQAHTGVVDVER